MVRRAVAAPLAGVLAVAAIGAAVLALVPLALGGRTVVALQGSMAPALPTGAAVVLMPAPPDAIRVGDIVAFVPPGRGGLVTHRVIAIEDRAGERRLVTRGDANPQPDAWRFPLQGDALRVALIIPAVGYPFVLLAEPGARIALLVLAAAIGWRARHQRLAH